MNRIYSKARTNQADKHYLLVDICNLSDLCIVYGADSVRDTLPRELTRRLARHLNISPDHVRADDNRIAVALASIHQPDYTSEDAFLEQVKAALCCLPIQCGARDILVNVRTGFGTLDGSVASPVVEGNELVRRSCASYRDDMQTAVDFLERVRMGLVLTAFQPVAVATDESAYIYQEALLRRREAGNDSSESCQAEVLALERLGLIDRLDRSVVWAIIEALEDHSSMRLGCNVSALSLQHDGWWRLIQAYLVEHPDVATRLMLEITETSAISDAGEAVNLLHTLRLLGCRIAIDDMGTGYSTLAFAAKVRPDFIKIDRVFVTHALGEAEPPNRLRRLIALCAELSVCVIAEGVETEDELTAALEAGARGLQGYLIGRPDALPSWLRKTVTVQDSFDSGHRGLAGRSEAHQPSPRTRPNDPR